MSTEHKYARVAYLQSLSPNNSKPAKKLPRSRPNSEASMTAHSIPGAPNLRSNDAALAPPYRITALEQALKRMLPAGTAISIVLTQIPLEEEKRLFPKFTFDRHYVHVRNKERSYSISGVSDWGVFWYRVDEGAPQHPDLDAVFWGTIDRVSSVAEFVAGRL
jgi:hypothetical protein